VMATSLLSMSETGHWFFEARRVPVMASPRDGGRSPPPVADNRMPLWRAPTPAGTCEMPYNVGNRTPIEPVGLNDLLIR
jgi:hypothetical protein